PNRATHRHRSLTRCTRETRHHHELRWAVRESWRSVACGRSAIRPVQTTSCRDGMQRAPPPIDPVAGMSGRQRGPKARRRAKALTMSWLSAWAGRRPQQTIALGGGADESHPKRRLVRRRDLTLVAKSDREEESTVGRS